MKCGICKTEEGELHDKGCSNEKCSDCGRRLISCPHKLEEREPFFADPVLCDRCGLRFPEMFWVSDELWKKVCGQSYDENGFLCKSCFTFIRHSRGLEDEEMKHIAWDFTKNEPE